MGVPEDFVLSKVSSTRDAEKQKSETIDKKFKIEEVQFPIDTENERQACKECFKVLPKNEPLTKHMLLHSPARPYGCEVCRLRFMRKSHLARHMVSHTCSKPVSKEMLHDLSQKPYNCDVCLQKFTRQDHLEKHACCHGSKELVSNDMLHNLSERPYQCEVCQQGFTRADHLKRHMFIHTGIKPLVCKKCAKRFARKDHLAKHKCQKFPIKSEQKDQPCVNMLKAAMQPTVKEKLQSHALVHEPTKPHVYEVCDKKFVKKIHLSNHVCFRPPGEHETGRTKQVSGSLKLHVCPLCTMEFSEKISLKLHMRSHRIKNARLRAVKVLPKGSIKHIRPQKTEELHVCKICGKQFAKKAYLGNHMRIHLVKKSAKSDITDEKEKRYICDLCSMTFATEEDLINHQITHVAETSHVYNTSQEIIGSEANLVQHIAIHADKVFKCDASDTKFVNKEPLSSQLAKSKEVVNIEKPMNQDLVANEPHVYEICGESFQRKGHLSKHMYSHVANTSCALETRNAAQNPNENRSNGSSAINSFVCSLCSREFSAEVSLKWHMILHKTKSSLTPTVAKSKGKQSSKHVSPKSEYLVCEVCSKKFAKKAHLMSHMRVHKETKSSNSKTPAKKPGENVLSHSETSVNEKPGNLETIHVMESHICRTCDEKFESRETLLQHLVIHVDKFFTCDACDMKFVCEENFVSHQLICLAKPKESVSNEHNESQDPVFAPKEPHICKICTKSFQRRVQLLTHMRLHTNKASKAHNDISSNTDNYAVKSPAGSRESCVDMAVESEEKQLLKQVCYICSKRFKKKAHLASHMRSHKAKKFTRNKITSKRQHLFRQKRSCLPSACICNMCSESFADEELLASHQLTHTAKDSLVSQTLGENLQDVDAQACSVFSCEACDIKCEQEEHLLNHKLLCLAKPSEYVSGEFISLGGELRSRETGDGEYESMEDLRSSKRVYSSKVDEMHALEQSPENCYTCKICGRQYSKKEHLSRHLLTHEGIFECRKCFQRFPKKKHLVRHMQTHGTGEEYACTFCSETFKTKDHFCIQPVHALGELHIGETGVWVSSVSTSYADNCAMDDNSSDTMIHSAGPSLIDETNTEESCATSKICSEVTSFISSPGLHCPSEDFANTFNIRSGDVVCTGKTNTLESYAMNETYSRESANGELPRNKFTCREAESESVCVESVEGSHLLGDVLAYPSTGSLMSKTCSKFESKNFNIRFSTPISYTSECRVNEMCSEQCVNTFSLDQDLSQKNEIHADTFVESSHMSRLHKEMQINKMCSKNSVEGEVSDNMPVHSAEESGSFKNFVPTVTSTPSETLPWVCKECNKTFVRKRQLLGHLMSHMQKKACNMDFDRKDLLVENMPIHTAEKSGVSQSSKKISSHSSMMFRICEICGEEFSSEKCLQKHMLIHVPSKSCASKAYSKKLVHTVPVHMPELSAREENLHHDEVFECKICSVGFSDMHELINHITTAACSKPYKCTVCPDKFSSASELASHMSAHEHEMQSHECRMCSKKFSSMMDLCKHVFTHSTHK